MALIKTLKNFLSKETIYPKTKTNAVYDDNGGRLDTMLSRTITAQVLDEVDGEEEELEFRDADTLGGVYTKDDIKKIDDQVTENKNSIEELNSDFINVDKKHKIIVDLVSFNVPPMSAYKPKSIYAYTQSRLSELLEDGVKYLMFAITPPSVDNINAGIQMGCSTDYVSTTTTEGAWIRVWSIKSTSSTIPNNGCTVFFIPV